MYAFGPAVDLRWVNVDPGRKPVRDRRAETTREKVRNERADGGGQGAYEDDLRELGYVAARAVSEERDDHIGRGGQRNPGLLDRDDAEEDDVLVLQDRKEQKSDRVADDRRQSHAGQSVARRTRFSIATEAYRGRQLMPAKRRTATAARRATAAPRETPNFFDRLEWRSAGPYRGGRVGAVAGDPRERNIFYFGSTGGGVWKTMDAGQYWENTSDKFFKRASVGAIAVAQADPNVIYAGMGESCIRGNVSHGDGVYRSTDAGQTWTHLGLEDTRNIAKVRVHPEAPDTASAAKSGRVYAIVEAEDGAIFRSDNFGETWERGSEDRNLRQRAWYYHHIFAHPTDPETVWVLNVSAWLSNDGGKTFQELSIPHGDHHDLWIDPKDPNRIINGNDGGAVVTLNGGESW